MGDLSTIKPFKDEVITEKKDKIGWQLQKWLDILWKALDGDLTINGVGLFPVQEDPVATTSGTSVSLITTIPSWARKVTLFIAGISTNGTSNIIVQIGPSGGVATTGYTGAASKQTDTLALTAALNTSGFRIVDGNSSGNRVDGIAALGLVSSSANTWSFSSVCGRQDTTASTYVGGGLVSLSGALTQIAITTAGGVDTFDAGSISIRYEY